MARIMTSNNGSVAGWKWVRPGHVARVAVGLLGALASASVSAQEIPGTRATVAISLTINQTRGAHYLTNAKREQIQESGQALYDYVVNPAGFAAESLGANYYAVKQTGKFRSFGRDPETGDLLYLPVQYVEQYDTVIQTTRYVTADFLRTLIWMGVIPENLPENWTRADMDRVLAGYLLQAVRFPTSSDGRLFFFASKAGKSPVFVGYSNPDLTNREIPAHISLMESGQASKDSYKTTFNIRQIKNPENGQFEESYQPPIDVGSSSVRSHCAVSMFPYDIDGLRLDLVGRMARSSAFNASLGANVDGAATLSAVIGSRIGYDWRSESLAAIAQVEGGMSIGKPKLEKNMGAYLEAVPEALRPVIEVEEQISASSDRMMIDNVSFSAVSIEAVGGDAATIAP